MAITSEVVGGLNTPGFGFKISAPVTYALPKFPYGATISVTRWDPRGTVSFDILDRETGKAVFEKSTTSYGSVYNSLKDGWDGAAKKGALLRINNSTEIYVFIIPNHLKAPPVWNGQ